MWSEEGPRGFGARAVFDPELMKLRIEGIQASEGGLYRCRLDFRRSPTRNVLVNLTVIGKRIRVHFDLPDISTLDISKHHFNKRFESVF